MRSPELQLALAPAATYQTLLRERMSGTWLAVLARPAFFMLLVGTLVAIIATRHVTIGLVLTIAVSWSFSLLVQALAGGVIIASVRELPVSRWRAFELLFLGHAPWSLWMLAVTALAVAFQPYLPLAIVAGTGVIPIAWTAVIVSAFCQTVLHTTKGGARRRTLLHQLVIWGGALGFLWFAVGGWTSIFQAMGL